MAERIYITRSDFRDLHALIHQDAKGRDGPAAERLAGELERALIVDREQLPPDAVTMAPVGAALLGLRTGDTIEWPLPGDRTVEIRILRVEQPARGEESAA